MQIVEYKLNHCTLFQIPLLSNIDSSHVYVSYMGRGHTKDSDEDDGNSWTDFVPPKEPFTGNFSIQLFDHM